MNANRPYSAPRILLAAPAWLGLLALAGCDFPPPQNDVQRAASQGCTEDANRVYNTQNRYLLSERDTSNTPFSGGGTVPLPSDGLSDRYSYDNMVSDCLKRSEAVPVAGAQK
jgi:hypothetical protein